MYIDTNPSSNQLYLILISHIVVTIIKKEDLLNCYLIVIWCYIENIVINKFMERQHFRKKAQEEKLIFLEGNFQSLVDQNYKLKDQIIRKAKQHSQSIQSIFKQLENVHLVQSTTTKVQKEVEFIKKYIKSLDQDLKIKNLELYESRKYMKDKTQLIKKQQQKIQQLSKYVDQSKKMIEIQEKKRQQKYEKINNQLIKEKQQAMQLVQNLRKQIKQKIKEIHEIHCNYQIEIKQIKDYQNEIRQQCEKQINVYKQKIERIKISHQQSKRYLSLGYAASLEMKIQQNQKLIEIIQKLNNKQKNVTIQQSLNMIMYREKLEKNINELKLSINDKNQMLQLMEVKIMQQEKNYRDTVKLVQRKNDQLQKLSKTINDLKRENQKKIVQIKKHKDTIQQMRLQKQQADRSLGRRWQHEIQKVILDYERKKNHQLQKYKNKSEAQFAKQKQILIQKINQSQKKRIQTNNKLEKQKQAKEKCLTQIQGLQNDIENHKKMYKDNNEKLNNKIKEQNKKIEQIIQQKKNLFQQKLQLQQQIKNLGNNISDLNKNIQDLKIESLDQKDSIIQKFQKKIVEIEKSKDNQILQTLKACSQKYINQISLLKDGYETQISTLMSTRQVLKKRINQDTQKLNIINNRKIQEVRKQNEQSKKGLQVQLHNQKIAKIFLIENHQRQISQLKQLINLQVIEKQQNKKKINQFQNILKLETGIKQSLNREIINLKINIQNLQLKIIKDLKLEIQKKDLELQAIKKQLNAIKSKYDNVKTQIILAKQEIRKQYNQLNNRNKKLVLFYKQKLRSLQQYIEKTPNQQVFLNQINSLKNINQTLSQNFVKSQAQVIYMKQTQKYHETKIQTLKRRRQINKTQRDFKDHLHTEYHHNDSDDNLPNNTLHYTKLSNIKKTRRYKVVENNLVKPGITNYGLMKNTNKVFKLKLEQNSASKQEYF